MSDSMPKNSYEDYLAVNKNGLSRFDYFYMIRVHEGLSDDFVMSFAALFNPTFFCREGEYFVEENYTDLKRKETLLGEVGTLGVAFWVNMVELTSLLGDISYEDAAELGAVIRDCWNTKLNRQFPDSGFEARLILEDDLDEVWVTLCKQ
ncbi:hypothetical protein [Pseudomonas coronafaciens]|uniref:hypothetical protein n=1 Tax=Pseudomonas coronafaciens TaxID=53409 RepID=UPI000EFFA4C0|nr:hypothetical protein [Pseudomonas coronafaciens]